MGSRRPILPRRTPPNFDMKSIALLMVAAAMWSQVACRPQFGLGGSSSTVQQQPGQANSVQQGNAAANMGGAMASGSNIQTAQGGGSSTGASSSQAAAGPMGFQANVQNQAQSNSPPGMLSSQTQQPGLMGGFGGQFPMMTGGQLPQLGMPGMLPSFGSQQQVMPGTANNVQTGQAQSNLGGAQATGSNIQNVQGGGSAQGSTNSGATGGLQGFTAGVNNMGTTNSQPGSMSSTQMQPMAFPSFPQFPQPIAVGK